MDSQCIFSKIEIGVVICQLWAGIAQSIQRLATGWTVRGSNPGGGKTLRPRPDRPWGPPSLIYNGYRVFPGGKATGTWLWPSIASSAEVKEIIELYIWGKTTWCSLAVCLLATAILLYMFRSLFSSIFRTLWIIVAASSVLHAARNKVNINKAYV